MLHLSADCSGSTEKATINSAQEGAEKPGARPFPGLLALEGSGLALIYLCPQFPSTPLPTEHSLGSWNLGVSFVYVSILLTVLVPGSVLPRTGRANHVTPQPEGWPS